MTGYDLKPEIDIEDVLMDLFVRDIESVESAHVGSKWPDTFAGLPHFIVVDRIGGAFGRLSGRPVVDIDVFAPTKAAAKAVFEKISPYLLGYPRSIRVGERLAVLDNVFENVGFHELPWDDSGIRRFQATYSFSVRR